MNKKLLFTIGLLISIIFTFAVTLSFATDGNGAMNGVNNAVNGVRNTVGGAENAVEGAVKDVTNTTNNANTGTKTNTTNLNVTGNLSVTIPLAVITVATNIVGEKKYVDLKGSLYRLQ